MEHVDNLSTLQIHNDRPIPTALQPAPVVDPDNPEGLLRSGRVPL
jgi:hypothetical protein